MSATATAPTNFEEIVKKSYRRPPVSVGMPILWYRDGVKGDKPYVGLVSDVGEKSIDITLLPKDSDRMRQKTGVRHVDDPENRNVDLQNNGAWDLTEETKMVRAALDAFVGDVPSI